MNSEDDETSGYVHRPGSGAGHKSTRDEPEPAGFGTKGWGLVAVLVLCTLVIPGVIYLDPSVFASVGIPYNIALLVLPLLPAGVLGLTAVWSMTGATNGTPDED
ncbi:hypothetical protein C499_02182 [Halogeometricum borinquense DSM 11551]|uniref:Uncharacterized protein n=1 Tax=Halogeometricum borinquense (strain ATCC 700274 / DSM 11551 / JCM 10706 / KCTC 4070 / PR3) TaxID=469382 RepID=E4NPH2_HALBP|nr:hypothetical protein [Halogeometricum borinquense]ADQ66527.1 hypothetical protein Hbor_09330 [Halogeometricum borinquense DSM 11551]ELY31002.1 hypothetical protein C499_02182 [Halogeometricum borinquense DSM 11551]